MRNIMFYNDGLVHQDQDSVHFVISFLLCLVHHRGMVSCCAADEWLWPSIVPLSLNITHTLCHTCVHCDGIHVNIHRKFQFFFLHLASI